MKLFWCSILATAFCLSLFGFLIFIGCAFTHKVEVIACDVGQGDAALVKYGQLVILIDTGPNSAITRCLQANIALVRPVIDLLILTHDDKDHIGGFSDVAKRYTIRGLVVNPNLKKNDTTKVVEDWMAATGRFIHPQLGGTLVFPGLHLKIVWNEGALRAQSGNKNGEVESNDTSVGVYLESEGFGFLSLGDLGCAWELAVTEGILLKRVDLLKISHHGSKTSSCLEYLRRVRPEAAYYSAGRGNSYGHPHSSSLENMSKVGAFLFGTDQAGEIFFAWNEGRLFVGSKKFDFSQFVVRKTQI